MTVANNAAARGINERNDEFIVIKYQTPASMASIYNCQASYVRVVTQELSAVGVMSIDDDAHVTISLYIFYASVFVDLIPQITKNCHYLKGS